MPINAGKYINPNWNNGSPPAIDATELNAMSSTLQNLDSEAKEVGDVVLTTRTDLGNNYLLCNGDVVTSSMYPALYPKLTKNGPDANFRRFVSPTNPFYVKTTVVFLNGYYIVIPNTHDSTTIDISYRNANSTTWNKKTITGRTGYRFNGKVDIMYVNGYYCLIVSEKNTSTNTFYGAFYYFTSLSNNTSSYVDIINGISGSGVNLEALYISYLNNRVCASFKTTDTSGTLYVSQSTSIPPTQYSNSYNISDIPCGRMQWDGSKYFIGSTNRIYYFSGTSFTSSDTMDQCNLGVVYFNGMYYAACCYTQSGSTSIGTYRLSVLSSLTGNIIKSFNLNRSGGISKYDINKMSIEVSNGYVMLPMNLYGYVSSYGEIPITFQLMYFSDIDKYIYVNNSSSFSTAINVTITSNSVALGGQSESYNPNSSVFDIIVMGEKSLPEIDGSGFYPMIKAN